MFSSTFSAISGATGLLSSTRSSSTWPTLISARVVSSVAWPWRLPGCVIVAPPLCSLLQRVEQGLDGLLHLQRPLDLLDRGVGIGGIKKVSLLGVVGDEADQGVGRGAAGPILAVA